MEFEEIQKFGTILSYELVMDFLLSRMADIPPPELAHIFEVPHPGRFISMILTLKALLTCYSDTGVQMARCSASFIWLNLANSKARYHEQSGYTFGCKPNTFEQFHNGPFNKEQGINMYYPF